MEIHRITSLQNPKILAMRKLYKSRNRKASKEFLVEGVREVTRGLDAGFGIESIYFCPDIIEENTQAQIVHALAHEVRGYDLTKQVYEKLAYRDNTEGVIALFRKRNYVLDDLIQEEKAPLIVLLEGVEKPGNLGAVLRTADAVRASGVIVTGDKVDVWHPNVIRASQGGVFTLPVVHSSNEEVAAWANARGISVYAAALPAYSALYEMPLADGCVLAFGTEAEGLSDYWLEDPNHCFTIPMKGAVDSLNVSVSVAVSLYEAVRQRGEYTRGE